MTEVNGFDDRGDRNPEDAFPVIIETEFRVRVIDDDALLVAEVVVAERGGFVLDPNEQLDDQIRSIAIDLSKRAGDALDRIAQETAWGR